MSPNIREYSCFVPFNPVEYVWIDFAASENLPTDADAKRLMEMLKSLPYGESNTLPQEWPLPFEKMAVLLPVSVENSTKRQGIQTVTIERINGELIYNMWTSADTRGSVTIRVFGTLKDGKKVFVSPAYSKVVKKTLEQCAMQGYKAFVVAMRRLIAMAVLGEKAVGVARCTGDAAVNAKRKKKGKRPFFDWTTIEVKPSAPSVPQGGTHASPKPHMRRGHIRRLKSGKIVTVKNMLINKHKMPEEGFVFHDYVA